MKTLTRLFVAACFVASALAQQPGQPPNPSPEHLKLALWFGEWTYEGQYETTPLGPGGRFTGQMTGRPLLGGLGGEYVFVEKGPSGETRTVEIDSYDPVAKNYPNIVVGSDGSIGHIPYTMDGNVASWEGTLVIGGTRVRDRGTDVVAPDGKSFTKKEEICLDGKAWLPFATMKATKVEAAAAAEERSGSVPRNGFRLYYRVVGARGPYVILLAGGPGIDVDYLATAAEALKGSYRVVLLEQRGTGRSVMPGLDESQLGLDEYLRDLEALRVSLGEQRLTLVGHSWGMTYALAYAAAYPDYTRGVISLGSGTITADFNRVFDDNRVSRLRSSEREVFDYWSAPARLQAEPDRSFLEILRVITPADFWDRAKGIEFAMRWRLEWCHGRIADVTNRKIMAGLDLRSALDKIKAPVLIVQGHQDVAGEANALEAVRHIPHAEIRFLHRAGHYTWLDQPEATWEAVLPFLARLP